MDYFSEGDKNTRYFHSLVKGRRKKIQIKRIKDDAGNWLEDVDSVAAQAVNFFHKQFTHEEVSEDSPIFNHIQELIREEDNILLAEQPTMEEVHKAVFELNGDSACGPDGFSGIFYQKCWEVIKDDVYGVVKAFFEGHSLPKSITHTNLVLLPKKTVVEAFSDMRPISLSNFINKVISRVVHDRLDKLLTRVISPNQTGFVKGMNIIENVLLTQEIAHGFFHSTRGVKQGDPLSPALFIIAAEALSRALNFLFDQPGFVGYGMPKWSADFNHLAYTDDTIIFSAAHNQSLQMIMDTLQEYEKVSGQLINKRKSFFYMFNKVSQELSQQVATITGFVRGHFPFTYLGVPITRARKRKVDYTALLKKVKDRLQTWKGKLLSYGGKAVLITSVLQSIPIHVLSAIRPPKCVIKELHRIFAGLFWHNKEEGRCRHWAAWLNMCIPKQEGGLGFSYVVPQSWQINEHAEDVSELMTDGGWNISKLMQLFPFKVPIDEVVASIGIPLASKCCCCHNAQMETINHLLLCGELATKWRNNRLHGGTMNLNRVIYDINMNIHMLCKVQFPGLNIPTIWHQIVQFFEGYKPTVRCRIIKWRRPASGVYKCNTDGAVNGNPGPSSAAFCIRNDEGDLVYVAAKNLTDGTNIVAETEAIRMGLRYCFH
ncbi:uncharacterized protein LOC132611010 [Lycium barbarum]|uniref:uncharacterized protein LOC132611010 n=1 Tax=Lycium barbarum TaxID=112863 RepID=UPI00293E41EA|nr:uncharacterized protein LOC132611010 [Lycium barbarum]